MTIWMTSTCICKYHDLLLSISDEPDDVVREILAFREENAVHIPNKFFK